MSIYYECRLNKLVLNLSARPDIYEWIKSCELFYNSPINTVPDPVATTGITASSRVEQLFYNNFSDDFDLKINTNNIAEVYIDCTIGNKNKDHDIEEFVIMMVNIMLL